MADGGGGQSVTETAGQKLGLNGGEERALALAMCKVGFGYLGTSLLPACCPHWRARNHCRHQLGFS